MARKDVLKGLLTAPSIDTGLLAPAPAPQRLQKGAIGAVSRSIADLKARSVLELDPHLIDAGGMTDRLESDPDEDLSLLASIRDYGQQVPVLVRPHPVTEGRFQIVYGRRRVLALRDLNLPVKALIRDLDDQALVMAQGQENTARRDLSFIEKLNFARQMEEAGYTRKVICDALTIDKTVISRMMAIADRVPLLVIEAIGSAPSVGRDRWGSLADLIEAVAEEDGADDVDAMLAMVNLGAKTNRSDDRFQALSDYLSGRLKRVAAAAEAAIRRTPKEPVSILAEDGLPLGQAQYDAKHLTLKLRRSQTNGFEDWLLETLPALYRDWLDGELGDPKS